MERKLTTIFASDVVGFSKMMGEDEVNTLKVLNERRAVIDQIIDDNGGIIFTQHAIMYLNISCLFPIQLKYAHCVCFKDH